MMRCDLLSSAMGEKLLSTLKKLAVLARRRLVPEASGEGVEAHGPEVFAAARAHGHRSSLHFLGSHDQLIRELLQAMFPNLIGNFFVSQILQDPESGLAKALGDLSRIVLLRVCDVKDNSLYRR